MLNDMLKHALALVALLLLSCAGAALPPPTSAFDPAGLKLVIGVDRTKTIEVTADGSVVSSETGQAAMKFVGQDLLTTDGSKILSLDGDELQGPKQKHLGAFEGDVLVLGPLRLSVEDDGVVNLTQGGSARPMRMHFDRSVAGRKRPAMMLVALVFAIYAASHPNASIDQFVD